MVFSAAPTGPWGSKMPSLQPQSASEATAQALNLGRKQAEWVVARHNELQQRRAKVVALITAAAKTGSIGDGKVFVEPLEDAMRIRTGERGDNAV